MALPRTVSFAFALALAAPVAQAAVVDLDTLSLGNGQSIEANMPGYGSEGPVTLDWDPTSNSGRTLLFWNGGYSGQNGAYCNSGIDCALDMTVANTHTVTLGSFRLGGWPDLDRLISWSVIDLATSSTVYSAMNDLVSGTTGLVVNVGLTSTAGFRILFGPDGYNGGLTDISYSYAPVMPAVPLPAAGWLLVAGLGALAALRRRASA